MSKNDPAPVAPSPIPPPPPKPSPLLTNGPSSVPPPRPPSLVVTPESAKLIFTSRLCHLLCLLRTFSSAPFTIQRLSEILLNPPTSYHHTNKFCNAVERCLSVTGTVDWVKDKEGIKKREVRAGGAKRRLLISNLF